MHPSGRGALRRLSPAGDGERQRSLAAAAARRTVHGLAVPRFAADDGAAAGGRSPRQPQAGATADAPDGDRGTRAEAADDQPGAGPTRSIPTCCGTWRSTGRTKPGRRTSTISRSGIPLGRGFLYLVAVIDWASRAVPSWRLSNTMDVSFCVCPLANPSTGYKSADEGGEPAFPVYMRGLFS